MLKLNDTVVYGTTGVCTVESIEERKIGKVKRQYYVLKPNLQTTSTVFVPADNDELLSKARELLTKDEIRVMINGLKSEPDIWINNDMERKLKFTQIVSSGDRKEYLRMFKTLSNRQKYLSEKGKRLHLVDERILREVQRLIFDEFSYVLGLDIADVQKMIQEETN